MCFGRGVLSTGFQGTWTIDCRKYRVFRVTEESGAGKLSILDCLGVPSPWSTPSRALPHLRHLCMVVSAWWKPTPTSQKMRIFVDSIPLFRGGEIAPSRHVCICCTRSTFYRCISKLYFFWKARYLGRVCGPRRLSHLRPQFASTSPKPRNNCKKRGLTSRHNGVHRAERLQ